MPQIGHSPGSVIRICGCIEHVQMVSLSFAPAPAGVAEVAGTPSPEVVEAPRLYAA